MRDPNRARVLSLFPSAMAACLALAATFAASAAAQTPPDLLDSPALRLLTNGPVLTGDVNGDGHVDLIYHQNAFTPVTLGVMLGDGLGKFGPEVPTSIAPVSPWELSAGDFDGDGRTDLAFIELNSKNVRVLHGADDGTFVDGLTLPLAQPGLAEHLTLCDADEDGRLDLIASQDNTNRLTLYRGAEGGGFVSPPTQIIADTSTSLLESADFDGDGHVDLITRFGSANPSPSIMFGPGDGSFAPPEEVAPIKFHAIGDLDGDGRVDVIGLSEVDGGEDYWSWQPGGRFVSTPIATDIPEAELREIGVGDLDRDGVDELLIAYTKGRLEVFGPAEGDGLQVAARYGIGGDPESLTVVDVDQDGGADLVAAEQHATVILSGRGDGTLQPMYHFDDSVFDLAAADLTGDGLPDVVAVFGNQQPTHLLRGRLGGGLEPPEFIDAGPDPSRVWVVDATGDGELDVLTRCTNAIAVAAGHGDGQFDPPLLSVQPTNIAFAEVGQFGGDALPDVGVILQELPNPGRYVHFLVNSNGVFTESGSTLVSPAWTYPTEFTVGDVDGDDDLDLLVRWNAGWLRVFINQPTGYEPGYVAEYYGFEPRLVDIDLDGDGDLVSRHFDVEVRLGDGAGGFAEPFEYEMPGVVYEILVEDIDGDDVPDLVFGGSGASFFQDNISVALGLGGGSYGPFTYWATGASVLIAKPADMNADGQTDLVLALADWQLAIVENGHGPWEKRGHSMAGAAGYSRLEGFGPLVPGSSVTLRVSNGLPGAFAFLIAGQSEVLAPFKGGVLVPQPSLIVPVAPLDAQGALQVSGAWPASMPSGAGFSIQVWRAEPGAPSGFAATTAIEGTTP